MDSNKHNKGRVIGLLCVGTFILALFGLLALSTNDGQYTSRDLLGKGGRGKEDGLAPAQIMADEVMKLRMREQSKHKTRKQASFIDVRLSKLDKETNIEDPGDGRERRLQNILDGIRVFVYRDMTKEKGIKFMERGRVCYDEGWDLESLIRGIEEGFAGIRKTIGRENEVYNYAVARGEKWREDGCINLDFIIEGVRCGYGEARNDREENVYRRYFRFGREIGMNYCGIMDELEDWINDWKKQIRAYYLME